MKRRSEGKGGGRGRGGEGARGGGVEGGGGKRGGGRVGKIIKFSIIREYSDLRLVANSWRIFIGNTTRIY